MCWYIILLIVSARGTATPILHGRYTRDVQDYELFVPRKLTEEGNFLTYSLGQYFRHDPLARKKRAVPEDPVHYGIHLGGSDRHVELWPNHRLLSPDAVVESRDPTVKIKDERMTRIADKKLCHYTGRIRGIENSRVAISTCDGLAGYISMNGERYYVEPLHEHEPNKRGQLLHMIYQKPDTFDRYKGPRCGTGDDWTEAWKMRFREMQGKEESKRGLTSVHRYLETLIVADKKFLDFHKNTDYEQYILTIMNMVSDYYHDASAGNQMDVVVVRVMFLEKEEEEIDLAISADADKTLASFCKWQQSVNPKDIKNPNHHDIAVLLTRYDICADNMTSCGLMGLAYVASACTSDKPCAINEDGGLILGIVVAHEIGHVMGCSHDEENISGCKPQADDQSYYVMSPFVHLHTNVWSTCSKTFITTFFDNDLGECLNDEPDQSIYPENSMLPGTVYDAKYQCQIHYPGSSVCVLDPEQFCEKLICRTEPDMCKSFGEPPADGTKCAENKWCYNKKCIEMGERPQAINGGWGEWNSFSACSRTCGGGVSIAERDCNNPQPLHRGRYCTGDRKKIKICNIQPCPEEGPSYRALQCTGFDSTPFQEKLYKWKPYLKEDDMCSLFCLNTDNTFVKLAPRAKDGTPCKAGTKNMCIAGVCRTVGCDFVIDSDALEDVCGVCKGDGTECKEVDRVFQAPPGHGYVKVAVIFRGARNIIFDELKPSPNTLAVTGPDEKKYYLNGDFAEMQDGVKDIGGMDGMYTHPEPNKELLVIHGPLKENIVLFVVFYSPENVGYRYKYAEPTSKSNYQPNYHWEFVDWAECSTRCGGGVEISESKCIEEKMGLVTSSFCQPTEKPPPKTRKCNEQACVTKWRIGKWGKCMACKNVSGIRLREVECVRESSKAGEEDMLEEDSECKDKKPGTRELCNSKIKCVGNARRSSDLPTDMMKRIWLQTVGHVPDPDPQVLNFIADTRNQRKAARDVRIYSAKRSVCDDKDSNSAPGSLNPSDAKPKLDVGALVKDNVDPEGIQLIEIPVKQSHTAINMSDEAFETVGDVIPDTLDFEHQKVYKGEEAARKSNALLHNNKTHVQST